MQLRLVRSRFLCLRHQLVDEQLLERLRLEVTLEQSADGDGDGARLLRDDDDHGVGIFAHANARAVAHTEVAAEVHILRQRQHTAARQDAPVADDDRTVVHRGLDEEDVFQQLAAHLRVHDGAGARHLVEVDLTLKDDQHARAGLGHLGAGEHRLRDGVFNGARLLLCGKGNERAQLTRADLL